MDIKEALDFAIKFLNPSDFSFLNTKLGIEDEVIRTLTAHRNALTAQGEEITRLREDLATYGRHMPGCNGQWPNYKCDCGWEQTRTALNTAARGEE